MNVSASMGRAEIDLRQLKETINEILDALIDRTKSGTFPLDEKIDNYWEVLGDDLFDVSKNPSELGVGSLIDDIELLASCGQKIKDGYPPVVYGLVHAVPILKFLAERHRKSNNP